MSCRFVWHAAGERRETSANAAMVAEMCTKNIKYTQLSAIQHSVRIM